MHINETPESTPARVAYRYESDGTLYTVREEGDFYVFRGPNGEEAHRHSKRMGIDAEGFYQVMESSDIFHSNPIYSKRILDLIHTGSPEGVPHPINGSHPAVVAAAYLRGTWTQTNPQDVHPAAYLPS